MGYQRDLNDQKNNTVINNPKIKKMIEDGAETAFDIWYDWDKSKFENEPIFQDILSYIKNNNTNIKT